MFARMAGILMNRALVGTATVLGLAVGLLERLGREERVGHFGAKQLSALSAALLNGPWPSSKTLKAGELWKNEDQPLVVYAVRRMG